MADTQVPDEVFEEARRHTGIAGVPPAPGRSRAIVPDRAFFALRAQCGRDARDPNKRVEQLPQVTAIRSIRLLIIFSFGGE